ncbi:MAG: hypothetical protein AB7U66_03355 [Hyphomicrobiaceae bacterium]
MQPQPLSSVNLLSNLEFDHGDGGLLRAFIANAEQQALARGVSLTVAGFDTLKRLNEENRKTWAPVLSIFDQERGGVAPEDGLAFIGYDSSGRGVTSIAARLYHWSDTTFEEGARSLKLFYGEPDRWKAAGETCAVTARATRLVSGRVVFVGAGWFHPEFRGLGLSGILSRLARAYAYARWRSDFTTGFVTEALFKARNSSNWNGFTNIDWALDWTGSTRGDARFAFVWMRPDQLQDDLSGYLARAAAKVDAVIEKRTA